MSVHARIKPVQRTTGVTALAGAAPQTGAGVAFPVVDAEAFTLSAEVYAQATTNNLTITAKWQARNASTGSWYDVYGPNGAAHVTMVTGTGSAVPATRAIAAPRAVYSAVQARCVVVTGVETAVEGDDEFSIAYNYRDTLMHRRPIIGPAATVTALSGAAPQTGAGASVTMGDVQPGMLCAFVYAKATTNLLAITGKWQVRDSATGTWIDARLSHSPADVAIVTGTGSAVTDTRFVEAPDSVYGHRFARYVVTTASASGGGLGTDEFSIKYQYLRAFG
jgi:hypothetical protein